MREHNRSYWGNKQFCSIGSVSSLNLQRLLGILSRYIDSLEVDKMRTLFDFVGWNIALMLRSQI